jgi:hypothetical protein
MSVLYTLPLIDGPLTLTLDGDALAALNRYRQLLVWSVSPWLGPPGEPVHEGLIEAMTTLADAMSRLSKDARRVPADPTQGAPARPSVLINGVEYVPRAEVPELTDERLQRALGELVAIQYFREDHKAVRQAWDALKALAPELAELAARDSQAAYYRIHGTPDD